jgi:aminopeptidase-like protein
MLENIKRQSISSTKDKVFKTKSFGKEIHQLISDLYPICRSITGNGVRETLRILNNYIPVEVNEVKTGTQAYDWTIPQEWNIKDGFISRLNGQKVIDFQSSNLHVVSYSIPVHKIVSLDELKEHIFTIPEHPDLIPYRTSYYKENWGFCLSHNQFLELEDYDYEVCIDSSLDDGYLTYGEYLIQGSSSDEVLISCHLCHPSLCNDNLSGIAISTFLAKTLAQYNCHYSYRFLFVPSTIGSIAWLSLNEHQVSNIKHGLVLSCLGDAGHVTYKKSRQDTAEIDRVVAHVLQHSAEEHQVINFFPYGYDERQYCSPGFNLPVGCLMRSPHGSFPEYHTSADNLEFVQPQYLGDSFSKCLSILHILENNKTYLNQNPKCEPRLGKRGLYRGVGGQAEEQLDELALLWVLNLSDGEHSLLDIAERSGLPFDVVVSATNALRHHELLKEF